MIESSIRRLPRPAEAARMATGELRDAFLAAGLFAAGSLNGILTDLDRMVVGAACPGDAPLELKNHPETGREYFLEQRELGAINIGGAGVVHVDGRSFEAERLDCVYVPAGARSVVFESGDRKKPARFYFLSCPAHAAHPAARMRFAESVPVALGSPVTANMRKIYKYIHPGGIQSCQLVMGFTALEEGSAWNSFPPHTHNRRSEVYLYFDLGDRILAHFMGEPAATRHLFVHNEQAVLSPPWSIHCGCGFGSYRFIWGMAGENKTFDDMDAVRPVDLR
jgi:4-deoxy-L-threo-5-hexosulose-uronate ketol-isomerase